MSSGMPQESTGPLTLRLPPKGALAPNNGDDPLHYYYVPLVGRLYVSRINIALGLLKARRFGSILEIGYGSGILLPTLCSLSHEVYGVDLASDHEMTSQQLARLGCHPRLSSGTRDRLLFEGNRFDLVLAISVLEHIKEIRPFLEEIRRVLKPGGLFLAGMPAVNKTMSRLFRAIGFPGIDDHHVTTPEEMAMEAERLFHQQSTARLPAFGPARAYLYKVFCFRKVMD
jgi:2-polyprenyl-3-methyl-5-hydroxy-6-metoxy-1,4-benzoquinol methylase